MKSNPGVMMVLAISFAWMMPAQAPSAAAAPDNEPMDVSQLFATTSGWCHSDGGRAAGKGPLLMDTKRDDDFLRNRIKDGKPGAMPAFSTMFSDAQIDEHQIHSRIEAGMSDSGQTSSAADSNCVQLV